MRPDWRKNAVCLQIAWRSSIRPIAEFSPGAIAAMKVIGRGVLGAWSGYVVPGFDKKGLGQLPAAAIRYVLDDERIDILNIGMRLKEEIDANIRTFSGDVTYTLDDRAILTEFCAQAYDSDAIKGMKMD